MVMGPVQLTTALWFVSVVLCEAASQNSIKNPKEQKTKHLLLISEVNADNPGDDNSEYVELYHTSGRQALLDGYHLVFYNGNGNVAYRVKDLKGFSTDSYGFFLVGSSMVKPRPSVILPKNTIQNGPDAIAVYFGGGPFDENMRVTNKSLVDALVHKSKVNDRADDLVHILTPGIEPYLEDPLFRTTDESLERCQGRDSHWFFQVATPTPGSDNHCVPFAQLNASTVLISEVNVVSAPGEFEFVELQGPSSTELKDLVLVLIEGSSQKICFAMAVSGRTSPDGLLLIGPWEAETQVDVPFPPNSSIPLLKAGLNAIALYRGANSSFTPGSVASATDLLDALVYTTVEDGDSKLLDILSPGKPIFYGSKRSQQGNWSMNRCVCCSTTRDASIYALGKPTPRYFNDCPKKRFSQEISLCLQGAGCQQESSVQHNIVMLLTQVLGKRCGCGVSPAHFRDAAVACEGPDLVFTALLMARSAETLASLLQDFSLFLESKEVIGLGEWNGTVVAACSRDASVTEMPPVTPAKPGTTKESPIAQVELLINEVNPDNPGAREDTEYVELFYPGSVSFDLRNYWLVLYNGKNNLAYMVVNLTGHRTDDHGYFLVGSDGVTPRPSMVLPSNTIQNGVDAVALYHSATARYQINMGLTDEGLVDAVVYKSRGSEKAERLLAVLAPGQSVLHEDDSYSNQDESLSRCHSLRPRSHDSFQVTAITPSRENACPPSDSNSTELVVHNNHSVLINEVGLANCSVPYWFIELKGTPGGSLKGYSLEFFSSQDHKPYSSIPLQGTFRSDGLFILLSEQQSRPGEAHDQLVPPSVWSNLSAQQQFHAVAVTSRARQIHNGTPATGQSLEDVVTFTLKSSASQGRLGFLGPVHVVSSTGEWPVSLSRCSSCSTTFAVSEATPGSENRCPQESLSVVLGICLQTPNCSLWPQNPLMLAGLRKALADSMEADCSCGICPCYLQGLNFTCFNSTLKLSGQLWARSSKQLQWLSKWQADFPRSSHLFVVDGKLLRSRLSCLASDRMVQSEASFQTWEIALAILGSILLALLLTGAALYFIKRRPQNYTTIEMNDHCEIMAGI
ncbi:uncharacterized protein LOC132588474 isoform X2 [Heteronotia binoei]|uniref:uncharacterized protein LOC132588474 isoform X2 n=1 Tax=Heteronotia binoei TaxID=13085 RepID=UPI00292D79FB|nr:uncharacterized protein LOC132588474 isoform X2 [Heteronotia binoei]